MIDIVDPRGDDPGASFALAPRPSRAALRRVGTLCNEASTAHGPLQFPRYLALVQRALTERIGPIEVHAETKPVLTRPADAGQLDRFRGWQVVINGLAK